MIRKPLSACLCALIFLGAYCTPAAAADPQNQSQGPQDILQYISSGWDTLTRSLTACGTVADPKAAEKSVLYLPAGFTAPSTVEQLTQNCAVRVEHLPKPIERLGEAGVQGIHLAGLLYLPNPYVVPGGRFNEMYGWDSYFILRGLVRAGRLELARGMVENFFFEIDHYGGILNANRTYYLTRSQPPFLTSMILAVYDAEKAQGKDDRDWLTRAYPYAAKDYDLWTHAPHLAGSTGLSRYFDFGEGPAPEELADDPGYYRRVAGYFLLHPARGRGEMIPPGSSKVSGSGAAGPEFDVAVCQPGTSPNSAHAEQACDEAGSVSLTADYYKGDRSMRESGFDVSFRYGPFSDATHHYADVGLNSLLYKTEKDMERISRALEHRQESADWTRRAAARRGLMTRYFWNARLGLFFDYNFETQAQSSYDYITTFYPLWAGLASPEQAGAVERNLKVFERPGGLDTSTTESGAQWDDPYGWAPTQLIAVEGLRRYGFQGDGDRLALKFLSTVLENFRRDGTIREKYNVVTRSSETNVQAGYTQNVVGFGWTNGVFLEFLHTLPPGAVSHLGAR